MDSVVNAVATKTPRGIPRDRLGLFRDQLMAVQSGHSKPYDMDDVMTFTATTSRVLLALIGELLTVNPYAGCEVYEQHGACSCSTGVLGSSCIDPHHTDEYCGTCNCG